MKKSFKILLAAGALALSLVGAQSVFAAEREIQIGINDAYIPSGFDSDTDAFAIVSGLFPNGCYSWNRSESSHSKDGFFHEIKSIATVSDGMCIMVLVPFSQEVRLGKLAMGNHKIRFIAGDGTYMEKSVSVE